MKYQVITFGCQMNKNDSERIESILELLGMEKTKKIKEADLIILNSCSIREPAENRIYSFAHNLSKQKKENPNLIIGVCGCLPGRDKDKKIYKKNLKDKGVELYFPNKEMARLPEFLHKINPEIKKIKLDEDYFKISAKTEKKYKAFIPIQHGCNQFCSYCIVPYSRGLESNRKLNDILTEIECYDQKEYKEITLLGEIVNHYTASDPENFSSENPYKKNDFAKLLWEINKRFKNIKRVTWTAPHPIYFDEEVIDALTLEKQVNYLHIPVQAGSDNILQKMNRKHNRDFFINVIKKIREKKPSIAISTDIIVGFCDESEKDFLDTVELYKKCDFDISYTAKYSDRSGTLASKNFKDNITISEKKRRWFVIQDLMEKTTYKKNQKLVNKKLSVLVDKYENGFCFGNSSEMKLVRFPSKKDLTGEMVEVKIKEAETWILYGNII